MTVASLGGKGGEPGDAAADQPAAPATRDYFVGEADRKQANELVRKLIKILALDLAAEDHAAEKKKELEDHAAEKKKEL